ncbi:MAG: hypothetical protein M3Q81_03320 [bacterium]|nr:hypothetical protein [bacterium]
MYRVALTPIIGLPQFDGWSHITSNASQTVLCSLAIRGLNAGNVGRDIVQAIEDFKSQDAAFFYSWLEDLIQVTEEKDCAIYLSALFRSDEVVLFVTYQGSIVLKRQDKIGVLLQSGKELKVIQGKLDGEDIGVLLTGPAATYSGELQQKLRQGYDVDTIITSLVPAVHSGENSCLSSLAFVQVLDDLLPLPEPESAPVVEVLQSSDFLSDAATEPAILSEISEETAPLYVAVTPELPAESIISDEKKITTDFGQKERITAASSTVMKKIAAKAKQFWSTMPQRRQQVQAATTKIRTVTRPALSKAKHWALGALDRQAVYVKRQSPRQLFKILIPIVLVIVAIILGWQWRQNQQEAQLQSAVEAAAPLLSEFTQAQALVETDPLPARSQMESALAALEGLRSNYVGQANALEYLEQEISQAQNNYQELSGRKELQALPVFFDLQTVAPSLVGQGIDSFGSKAVISDAEKKTFIILDLENKATQQVVLDTLAQVNDISASEMTAYVLGSGITQLNLSTDPVTKVSLKEEGDSDRDGTQIGSFNTYIYVLNPLKRNIYRYPSRENGLDDPIGWLRPGQSLPYDQINSMSIDGDIWLTTRNGEVLKLSMGEAAEFTVKGLTEPFSTSLYIYTKENWQQLYILEPAKQRVVVLSKDGVLIKEIRSPSLASATGIIANETLGKAYALSGSLLFEIQL